VLLGLGSGAFVQAGYAVLFSILESSDMAFGTSFMMLGIHLPDLVFAHAYTDAGLAQLCGITFGLAIASAIFVNDALSSIASVLPDLPQNQIQQAIEGAAGELFASLDGQSRAALSDALVISLRKAFVVLVHIYPSLINIVWQVHTLLRSGSSVSGTIHLASCMCILPSTTTN
jgi:hypothetical protein